MPEPTWPDIDTLTQHETALIMRGYLLGLIAGERDATAALTEARCDWEHGVCCCPGCGAVVQIVNRQGKPPAVTDGDGREHYCQRQIAAVLAKHGVAGMTPILRKHAERRPIPKDPSASPTPGRAPLGVQPPTL